MFCYAEQKHLVNLKEKSTKNKNKHIHFVAFWVKKYIEILGDLLKPKHIFKGLVNKSKSRKSENSWIVKMLINSRFIQTKTENGFCFSCGI